MNIFLHLPAPQTPSVRIKLRAFNYKLSLQLNFNFLKGQRGLPTVSAMLTILKQEVVPQQGTEMLTPKCT